VEAEKTDVMKLLLQYPNAGIRISDTVEEATVKASAWSGEQVEGYKASDYQIITDAEGKMWRVNKLTGEKTDLDIIKGGETDIISQSVLNKLASSGVPNDMALTIQGDINAGHSFDEIFEGMKSSGVDAVQAGKYIDDFRNVMKAQGTISLQPVEILESYENKARETEGTTKTEKEDSGFVWYNPLTWF